MKMKVLLSVIVFTLYTVSYAQNMKMIDTSMPKKDKKDAVVIEYDSLTNIRPYKDASYYKQFIGQSILFYPSPTEVYIYWRLFDLIYNL